MSCFIHQMCNNSLNVNSRHARKARINSFDVLGDALEKTYTKLKTHAKAHDDLDSSIQVGSYKMRDPPASDRL